MGTVGYIKDWFAATTLYLMSDVEESELQSLPWVCTEGMGGTCYLLT